MTTEWIFLYGPPGCGKSAQGRMLAQALDLPFHDLDEEIEQAGRMTIPELFAIQGEAAFRRLEQRTLMGLLTNTPGVVALGGGSLLDEASREKVEACGPVVCLNASIPVLIKRLSTSAVRRPLLKGNLEVKLRSLVERRHSHYASFPLQVSSDGFSLEESIWQVQIALRRFHLTGMGDGCDVRLSSGSLSDLGQALHQRGLHAPVVLVSDENVARLYSQVVLQSLSTTGLEAKLITFPAGEQHKTLTTLQSIWQGFLIAGLERTGTVIAMGGGVVSDLAGFAAATFMRGVDWAIVPTSLLAMADASIGGKTGVDLPQGKNLVGAYHCPRLVWVDPQVLNTLPEDEMRCGLAEVVKAAIIADPQLFALCSQGLERLENHWLEVIARSMAVKIQLVQEDPFEHGRRAALNLGHSIGHALECVSGYQISHGKGVAIGLVAEAYLAERIGLAFEGLSERISAALSVLGLPVEIPAEISLGALIRAMQVDKKRRNGVLRFALPAAIGDVRTGVMLKPAEILDIMDNYKVTQ